MILTFIRLLVILLAIIATSFLLPIAVGLYYGESLAVFSFALPMCITCAIALVLFFSVKKQQVRFSVRTGFVVVALAWFLASILGAIPFLISGTIPNLADAFFESASGFTTTGATILSEVESLPRSINLWRTQMHWLGGMGIVALTVALMPLLGIGGFQLIKAETTGPEKGKVTPKIAVTAKMLWIIYLVMTVVQTILLMAAGMDFVDALAHTFASLGTGGFSTKNTSVAAYNSAAIDWICIVFMALAGVNFSLYFQVLIGKGQDMLQNTEFKVYVAILIIASLLTAVFILPQYGSFLTAIRYASFQVVSIITTTGFATADYNFWPAAAQMILFTLMFIGSCSGSTAGNIKVVRWVILAKQMANEVRRMLHPHGVFTIRLNNRPGRKDLVFNVAAFIFLYFVIVFITAFVAALGGADLLSAFTASLALVGNIGPGFGLVGPAGNYGFFADWSKWWFSFAMIAGRLELYTVCFFFMPSFWKR